MRAFALLATVLALSVPFAAQAGEVSGKVFDARGRAAAGVELELAGQRTVTAADGSFVFAEVTAGEHNVVAGSQAVAVSVPAEGAVRRNVFLLSGAARTRVTGEIATPADNAAVLADAMRMGRALLAEDAPARQLADISG